MVGFAFDYGLEMEEKIDSLNNINEFCSRLGQEFKDFKVILLMDEVVAMINGESCSDWSLFENKRANLDVLLALSPQSRHNETMFQVVPPSCSETFSKQLFLRHRNCLEIARMVDFFKHVRMHGHLDTCMDYELDSEKLPSGRLPLWIEADDIGVWTYEEVLEYIKSHIESNDSVTLLRKDEESKVDSCSSASG